jgi:AbrB family looped-hinge helix DNA binding protein
MALTQVKAKFQITLPKKVREVFELKVGDFVEAVPQQGGILLRPKMVVDKVEDLDTQLAASEAAVKAGRTLGPFKTAGAALKAAKVRARSPHRAVRR